MSNTYLNEDQMLGSVQKGTFLKYELKIQHLNELNKKFSLQNKQLQKRIELLQNINRELSNSQDRQSVVFKNFRLQNQLLRQKNQQLSKQNQMLLAKILIHQQMNIQSKKQAELYLNRYQQKIVELRQNLQIKQIQIQVNQQKLSAYKGLQLPMSTKNASRFTIQILKYQTLIQEMINQKNKNYMNDLEEIQSMKGQNSSGVKQKNKKVDKIKPKKNPGQYMGTEVRGNIRYMQEEATTLKAQNQKYQVVILRLHLQLRQLKRKYRQRLDQISELKTKDKFMKQGYNTLTKQIQKYRNQNCQLKIQLDHVDRKLKTQHEIYKNKSHQKILLTKQTSKDAFSSELSIQANLSDAKNCLKITSPSTQKFDTFDNTSKLHNFDEKIQNIEGILSLDSSPTMKNRRRKDQQKSFQNEQLSICQQDEDNDNNTSISLDASGFMAPQKSHHQISQHILTGLMDRRIL